MPRPSHRLDLLVVPVCAGLGAVQVQRAFDDWVAADILTSIGTAGARADDLVVGGFARVRIDRSDGGRLYGNQAGGFRANCGQCGDSVAKAVVESARVFAEQVVCPGCSVRQHLNEVRYTPPAAWATACLWIHDVATAQLGDGVQDRLRQTLGSYTLVYRRP